MSGAPQAAQVAPQRQAAATRAERAVETAEPEQVRAPSVGTLADAAGNRATGALLDRQRQRQREGQGQGQRQAGRYDGQIPTAQRLGPATDQAERQADQAADRVAGAREHGPPAPAPATSPRTDLGPGQPLEPGTRVRFESALSADLGEVRVHADEAAAQAASSAGAAAYTVGQHVVFGRGSFVPSTVAGAWLLAHELAHTVQHLADGTSDVVHRAPLSKEFQASPQHQKLLSAIYSAQWSEAAKLLNEYNKDGIEGVLAELHERQIESLYLGAVANDTVGENAQVATVSLAKAPGLPSALEAIRKGGMTIREFVHYSTMTRGDFMDRHGLRRFFSVKDAARALPGDVLAHVLMAEDSTKYLHASGRVSTMADERARRLSEVRPHSGTGALAGLVARGVTKDENVIEGVSELGDLAETAASGFVPGSQPKVVGGRGGSLGAPRGSGKASPTVGPAQRPQGLATTGGGTSGRTAEPLVAAGGGGAARGGGTRASGGGQLTEIVPGRQAGPVLDLPTGIRWPAIQGETPVMPEGFVRRAENDAARVGGRDIGKAALVQAAPDARIVGSLTELGTTSVSVGGKEMPGAVLVTGGQFLPHATTNAGRAVLFALVSQDATYLIVSPAAGTDQPVQLPGKDNAKVEAPGQDNTKVGAPGQDRDQTPVRDPGAVTPLEAPGPTVDDPAECKLLLAAKSPHWHHIFPRQFREQFAELGIDIDHFTVKMPWDKHIGRRGVHINLDWNVEWHAFLEGVPHQLTDDQRREWAYKAVDKATELMGEMRDYLREKNLRKLVRYRSNKPSPVIPPK